MNIFRLRSVQLEGARALVHAAPHGRRDENNPVTSDEEHRDVPLGRPVHLLVGLFVDLNRGDGFLDVAQDHVEVLIVGLDETVIKSLLIHYIKCQINHFPSKKKGNILCDFPSPEQWENRTSDFVVPNKPVRSRQVVELTLILGIPPSCPILLWQMKVRQNGL